VVKGPTKNLRSRLDHNEVAGAARGELLQQKQKRKFRKRGVKGAGKGPKKSQSKTLKEKKVDEAPFFRLKSLEWDGQSSKGPPCTGRELEGGKKKE